MNDSKQFVDRDRELARTFAQAASEVGLKRIVYLGGLGDNEKDLSPHLASRHEVGRVLAGGTANVTELRASVIIGAGSTSFEMIRNLVDRLPVMVTPKWVYCRSQPIAISDVVLYLMASMNSRLAGHKVIEIGGPDQVSYRDLMRFYARSKGLRRWMLPVPVLTPWLSSLWLAFVTPLYAKVGRALIASIRHETLVNDPEAQDLFDVRPMGVERAFQVAIRDQEDFWSGSSASSTLLGTSEKQSAVGGAYHGRYFAMYSAAADASPSAVFRKLKRLGRESGWLYMTGLWTLRGEMERLFGGNGYQPVEHVGSMQEGSSIDLWTVDRLVPGKALALRATAKMPGRAWLRFDLSKEGEQCRIIMSATFEPHGLPGHLYWQLLRPLHALLFVGMMGELVKRGEDPSLALASCRSKSPVEVT
jgi:uncharacterized protein YbjT (DUF2867 family)